MNPKLKTTYRWSAIILAGLAVLTVLFYAEENWRGQRAWKNYQHEQEVKGVVLDWNKFIPPTVQDEKNFFKAPKMQVWFVKTQSALSNELTQRLVNPETTATNFNETAASKYLAWSDQFEPDFDLIRSALKRPYARMEVIIQSHTISRFQTSWLSASSR